MGYELSKGTRRSLMDEHDETLQDLYALYSVLGPLGGRTKIFVDTQDGRAYQVTAIRRDLSGDLILETVPQDATDAPPIQKYEVR